MKVDNLPRSPDADAARRLRAELGLDGHPAWLAGSTHPGEESLVFRAYLQLAKRFPTLRLIVAPRHLERLPAIEAEAERHGLVTRRRRGASPGAGESAAVILVDTMGELASMFAAADIVFLGGSLVPVGGHNVLEPAAQGRPLLLGPYVSTVKDFAEELLSGGAAVQVMSDDEMADRVAGWLDAPEARRAAGEAAREVVDRHRGATERTMDLVRELGCLRAAKT